MRLRKARKAKGCSLEELAALVGLDGRSVQLFKFEGGYSLPSRKCLKKLCDVLGADEEHLTERIQVNWKATESSRSDATLLAFKPEV